MSRVHPRLSNRIESKFIYPESGCSTVHWQQMPAGWGSRSADVITRFAGDQIVVERNRFDRRTESATATDRALDSSLLHSDVTFERTKPDAHWLFRRSLYETSYSLSPRRNDLRLVQATTENISISELVYESAWWLLISALEIYYSNY